MAENRKYLRFSLADRIEHWILTISFTTLAITGLVQKYASSNISQSVIEILGGVENVRLIHRYAAILMMLEVVYHIGIVGYRLFVRRVRLTMLPGLEDINLAIQALLHNLGLREERPQQGRYTFEEKAEYWAVVWGTLVMVVTGFMLWNPIATARFLPGEFIPAAKLAHGGEAVLATLAIIVWHLYGVHVKIFNKSIFTGHLTEEEMLEEHPLELAQIKARADAPLAEPATLQRRRQSFLAVYAVLAVIMLAGIYWFVSFEETAITTVPPAEEAAVFVPLTPTPLPTAPPTPTPKPTPTPEPTSAAEEPPATEAGVTWQDLTGLFEEKCVSCHNEANAMGGLDLSSYESALAGVQPGEPEASSLVTLQAAGGHPGQFTDKELEQVRLWIADGAPESPTEAEAPAGEPEAGIQWQDLTGLFEEKCVSCHSEANAMGGLDLSSYESALAGVQPGDPEASSLVTLQAAGGHPGQFTDKELEQVRQWIADGAPESPTEAEAPAGEPEVGIQWQDLTGLFEEKCVSCHNEANAMGGLDLSSYESALAGVQPGDPEASSLVTLQAAGGHPGQFTDKELEQVRQWIADGAPE